MDSESWLVIEESGNVEDGRNISQDERELNKEPELSGSDEPVQSEDEAEPSQSQNKHIIDQIGEFIRDSEAFNSVNDWQRQGLKSFEERYAAFQKQFNEIADSATSKSLFALERIKKDVQQVMSIVTDQPMDSNNENSNSAEVPPSPPSSEYGSATPASLSEKSTDKDSYRSQLVVIQELIPQLVSSGKPVFDGNNFRRWFNDVKPIFQQALVPDPKLYLHGIKLYSEPTISALLDDFNLDQLGDWRSVETRLHTYFEVRSLRIREYEKIALMRSK